MEHLAELRTVEGRTMSDSAVVLLVLFLLFVVGLGTFMVTELVMDLRGLHVLTDALGDGGAVVLESAERMATEIEALEAATAALRDVDEASFESGERMATELGALEATVSAVNANQRVLNDRQVVVVEALVRAKLLSRGPEAGGLAVAASGSGVSSSSGKGPEAVAPAEDDVEDPGDGAGAEN